MILEKNTVKDTADERVALYLCEGNPLGEAIEHLIADQACELIGYTGEEAVRLRAEEIVCFTSSGSRVYAWDERRCYTIRLRLYRIEELLSANFIRINQSCLANMRKIERFNVSFSGTMQVHFRGGYRDYVSRRNLRSVKERFGL
ncbi:MAG: LytTR family transcriptional regulator [Clostridia bacterium]|nr:LytTR family transcriptional regulator [Clostridia bacterium]